MSLLSRRSYCAVAALLAAASLSSTTLAQRSVLSTLAPVSKTPMSLAPVSDAPVSGTNAKGDRVGLVSTSKQVQAVISLPLRNQDALNALLADLYNPASASYHQWLQPAEFDARFGPTASDYATLLAWARSNALDIVATSKNNRVLTVQASTGLLNRAFHVQLTSYHDKTRNRDFQAPDREPTMDINIPVLTITGLDTSAPRVNHMRKQQVEETTSSRLGLLSLAEPAPKTTGSGPSGTFIPSDMRAAYYGSGALTGTGQNVAIFSYDGYLASDVTLWYTHVGIPASTVPVTNVLTGGFDGGCELDSPCDDGEQVLDILQVQGMAPGLSNIYFYEGLSAVTELNQMASDNFASVISSSWGGGDFGPGTTPALLQMQAQGQTYLNATGDDGAFNGFTYLPPSSDPNITQVGGTDLTTASAGGAWSTETGWAGSGGGFFDPFITIPSWQKTSGVVTSGNAGSSTLRNSPDIAAEANYDNTQVSNGAFSSGWGGTSYATPRMAGYIALANQQSVANGTGRLGFLNPTLYQLGLNSQATYFHDITSGKNTAAASYNGSKAVFNAVAGYDLVTGWGSPNGPALINALVGPNFTLSASVNSITVVRSSTASFTELVNPINNFTGTPTFSVTGLPSGVTAIVTNVNTNQYSVLLTADGTAGPSSSTVTVTATSGAIVQSTTIAVSAAKRAGYDFTISATSATVSQTSSANSLVTVQLGSGTGNPVNLSASSLPAGVSVQFGTPSTLSTSNMTFYTTLSTPPGTYTVLLTGAQAGGITHTVPVTLTVVAVPSILADGDFESATSPWNFSSTMAGGGYLCNEACGYFPHSGANFAYMNGWGATDTDILSQTVAIPNDNTVTLNLWLMIGTAETSTTAKNDTFTISVVNASKASTTIATFSNLDKSPAYVLHSYDLSAFKGQTVTLTFTGKESKSLATAFFLDDISIVAY